MSQFEKFIRDKVINHINGKLIRFSINGNDDVGYLCEIVTLDGRELRINKENSKNISTEISTEVELDYCNDVDMKSVFYEIERVIINKIQNNTIESLELEINPDNVHCQFVIQMIEYTLVDKSSEKENSFVIIRCPK